MARSDFNADTNLSDLTGKVAIVTGATSGLGYAVTRQLLRKGATVYLAARSESKAVAAISRLEAEGLGPGNGKPVWLKLELDDPHDVKKAAEEFLSREKRLDILINNAGIVGKSYAVGSIGVQDVVTVNYVSPFLFTKLLLPLLKKTAENPDADVRIVNVSSVSHSFIKKAQFQSRADLNGPSTANGQFAQMKRYGLSKLLTNLWTRELARRLSASEGGADILVIALHPGGIATEGFIELVKSYPWPFSLLANWQWFLRLFMYTPEQAAITPLVAAAHPDLKREKEKYQGSYLIPLGKLGKPTKLSLDEGLAKDAWNLTEKILQEEGL